MAYVVHMAAKTENEGEYLSELADLNGVSCATVKDGHVLVFKRSKLEQILRDIGDKEKVVIFIKRPDMQS